MAELNYTKGEWAASHPLNDITTIITPEFLLAKIEWGTMVKEPQQRANAHLIAAAPELYEALRLLAGSLETKAHPVYFQMAKEALAKAEGGNDV